MQIRKDKNIFICKKYYDQNLTSRKTDCDRGPNKVDLLKAYDQTNCQHNMYSTHIHRLGTCGSASRDMVWLGPLNY